MANAAKLKDSKYLSLIREAHAHCEAFRRDTENPQDISLAEYFLTNHQVDMEGVYKDLGINPSVDTIQNMVNMPSTDLRWLIPEIFRDALRLGLRKNPIYPNIVATEQSVKQTSVTMPAINMSDAAPRKVGIAQTIQTGEVSFDQKTVKINKFGRGIKVPYEVIQYVSLNLVALFLQDFGVKLGMGIDAMAINTLINGDQANGSDSIQVIGIGNTTTGLEYRDLLKIWIRGSRLGKNFGTMLAGETMAMDVLDLLTSTRFFGVQRANVTMKSPIPQNADVFVHGLIPTNRAIILDPSSCLIKLNAQPLLVESEKIISNQTEQTFATLTTGFSTIYRDSRVILDTSLAFAGNGFPSWMDPTAQENVTFD